MQPCRALYTVGAGLCAVCYKHAAAACRANQFWPAVQLVDRASMKPVLCVGLVCLDQVTVVAAFPQEDTDQRSIDQETHHTSLGGDNRNVMLALLVKSALMTTS